MASDLKGQGGVAPNLMLFRNFRSVQGKGEFPNKKGGYRVSPISPFDVTDLLSQESYPLPPDQGG
jgi:hypothetical protein